MYLPFDRDQRRQLSRGYIHHKANIRLQYLPFMKMLIDPNLILAPKSFARLFPANPGPDYRYHDIQSRSKY